MNLFSLLYQLIATKKHSVIIFLPFFLPGMTRVKINFSIKVSSRKIECYAQKLLSKFKDKVKLLPTKR